MGWLHLRIAGWGSTSLVPHDSNSDIDSSGGIGDSLGEMGALAVLKLSAGVSTVIAGAASGAVLNDGSLRL